MIILDYDNSNYSIVSFQMKNQRKTIKQVIDDFANKFLRASVYQDQKLELDLGYQWKIKPNHQNSFGQNYKSIDSTNRLYSDRDNCQYFNLAMLFFSQIATESSLDIDLLDTMFFHPDHSIYYIYKDSRKGLIKTKQRGINACEMFLKRKLKKKQNLSSRERTVRKYKPITTNIYDQKSQKSIKQELSYMALLKYKDGTFIRLKQTDLRSIFTNPLYANQKFRHNNCTQYIQSLPQDSTDQFRIHFIWQKYKDHPLVKIATSYQLGACDYGDRHALRKQMLEYDQLVYLYYTVFEICSFVCIHYNKRVITATFHFVKDADTWFLAGIESAKVILLTQKQFMKANLWEENKKVTFGELKENQKQIFKLKEEAKSEFYKKIQNFFDQTNNTIKNGMTQFVQNKIDNVKRSSDKLLSRTIFQILHPQNNKINLYDLLDSPDHLARLVSPSTKKKQPRLYKKHDLEQKQPKKQIALKKHYSKKQIQSKYVYRGIESIETEFGQFQE